MSKVNFKKVLYKSKSLKINKIKFTYRKDFMHAIGFTVSKNYGSAVKRNLFKRRCRAAYHDFIFNSLFDCAIIVTPIQNNLSWIQIKKAFEKFVENVYDK